MRKISAQRVIGTLVLLLFAALVLLPLFWLGVSAFKSDADVIKWPPIFFPTEWVTTQFAYVWKVLPIARMLLNTVVFAGGVTIISLFFDSMAAYAFARMKFTGRKLLFGIILLTMMIPFQVMLLGNYLVLDKIGLLDSLLGIIFPAVFSTFPIFIMYRFFKGIPLAFLEAARLDGAGELKLFFIVAIPLGSPGVISAIVLGFLEYWNLIEQPMAFLKTKELWPLSLYLPNIELEQAGFAFAASVVALAPAVLVFLSGQDYLEQGIVSTAVKE